MRSLALVGCLLGCSGGGSGSLELTLALPTQTELRPAGMVTVTVTATPPGESPISTTSALGDGIRFPAGDFPVGNDVQLSVVLRDVSNRIVGVGEASQTIDIVGDQATAISIPVRRPFIYASSGSALYSFDPTLDPRDMKFQGKLAGVTAPLFTISVGGDRLAVVSADKVEVVVTATNMVTGSIPVPMGVRDAAAVPGTNKLAIAHGAGIAFVDLDMSTMQNVAVGPVDRITVGAASGGGLMAYGLVGRVLPPEKPAVLATCMGTSSIVAVSVVDPVVAAPQPLNVAISDIAAAPDSPRLYATLPCGGKVARVDGDIELGALTLTDVAMLPRAAVLTVAGDRVWAAGTRESRPQCVSNSALITCTPTTPVVCPQPNGNRLSYVIDGAAIIVQSIPLDGGNPIVLEVPDRRETIIDQDDPAKQHAQVLKALGAVPVDLVTLPGGQYVGLATKSRYYIEEYDPTGVQVILPCLDAATADWLLLDMASSSVAQRVRTSCQLTPNGGGPANVFQNWECDLPPLGERSMFLPNYQPSSVGALFGAR